MTNSSLKFAVLRLQSLHEAAAIIKEFRGWVFRGHEDARWFPSTALERLESDNRNRLFKIIRPTQLWQSLKPKPTLLSDSKAREGWLIDQFRRRAHHFIQNLPAEDDTLEWLSLMQHHGAPTRLLDVARSFYVASFFALEEPGGDSAVWAINAEQLLDCVLVRLQEKNPRGRSSRQEKASSLFAQSIKSRKPGLNACCIPVEPRRMNERMAAQRSLFIAPTDPTKTFLSQLLQTFGLRIRRTLLRTRFSTPDEVQGITDFSNLSIIKFVYPAEIRIESLRELNKMNINAATLFPGIDGFARYLRYYSAVNNRHTDWLFQANQRSMSTVKPER